jgi:hypothetical protein
MMRLLSVSFFLLCSITLFAQIANVPGMGNEVLRTKKYTDISGSPYLYPEWKSGTIIDKNGKTYPNSLIKYDAYGDVVEINQEGTILVLNSDQYKSFQLGFADDATNKVTRQTFRSGFNQIPGVSSKAYFEILHEGQVLVLKRYDIKFVEEVVNSYGTAAQTKRFQRSERYYIVNGDKATEFKLNAKSFLAALGEKQADMEKFIAKEKIKMKSEDDVAKVMAHYESL